MNIKRLFNRGIKFLTDADYRFLIMSNRGKYNSMPDEEYLKRTFKVCLGTDLDLNHPQTFSEKMQWLKLYNRRPEYTVMVDKYRMRDYITEKLGEGYVIPLLGVWDDPEKIDFDALPNQFVLKCNHNSGLGMCICQDKSKLDIQKVKKELHKGMKQDYYLTCREWPYKDVPRRIICEKFMVDESNQGVLTDYKFFCFNGEPKLMYISHDAAANATTDIFDMDFNRLEMQFKDPPTEGTVEKPVCFDQMREFATKLSAGIPFVRVDFYFINNRIYVGELTFFHNGGFGKITPEEWNYKLGSWITLPSKTQDSQ